LGTGRFRPAHQQIVEQRRRADFITPIPARRREGEEVHYGHLLGARREHLKQYGRWAFAEFTAVYQIETDFAVKVASEFNAMSAKASQS